MTIAALILSKQLLVLGSISLWGVELKLGRLSDSYFEILIGSAPIEATVWKTSCLIEKIWKL